MRSYDRSPRSHFEEFASNDYDLVWFSTAATYALDGTAAARSHRRGSHGPGRCEGASDVVAPATGTLRRWAQTGRHASRAVAAMNRMNAYDWKVFQRSVAAEVDRVILCSDDDVRRSGIPNAVAVPNTYSRPERSLGRPEVGTPPTILFQGSLHYGPNIDAVDWLIDEVAPRLWAAAAGRPDPSGGHDVAWGGQRGTGLPHVIVAGRVPEMEPELARADIAVVPLRIGSGTRLKILESFAHRIPVVSTTVGADGLDVEDGVHLLLADRPEEFAGACRRLIEDRALARRLVDAAERRYLERYEWSTAKSRIQQLVCDLAASLGGWSNLEAGAGCLMILSRYSALTTGAWAKGALRRGDWRQSDGDER